MPIVHAPVTYQTNPRSYYTFIFTAGKDFIITIYSGETGGSEYTFIIVTYYPPVTFVFSKFLPRCHQFQLSLAISNNTLLFLFMLTMMGKPGQSFPLEMLVGEYLPLEEFTFVNRFIVENLVTL